MKVAIEIRCDNAAFCDGFGGAEVGRILEDLAKRFKRYEDVQTMANAEIRDANGNRVGQVTISEVAS